MELGENMEGKEVLEEIGLSLLGIFSGPD